MLQRLTEPGLVDYVPYKGARLTASGERVALEVIRHHRLIEAYLSEALGMPSDRVHEEAEVLEHYISEELEALIAAKLGEPSHDPHGTPIPGPALLPPSATSGSSHRPKQRSRAYCRARPLSLWRHGARSMATAAASVGSGPSSAPPSSPPSPTSTLATSLPTSPAAPSLATCCFGSCSPPTWS